MKTALQGWGLIEGRIDMLTTRNPTVSEVIAAIEALRPEVEHPFVILEVPAVDDGYQNYCQVFSDDRGYVCEIRIFNGAEFCHMRAYLRDALGNLGDKNDPQFLNLVQAIRVFTDFIADPNSFPSVEPVEWLDVSDDFEPVG